MTQVQTKKSDSSMPHPPDIPNRSETRGFTHTWQQVLTLLAVSALMLPPLWVGEFGTFVLAKGAIAVVAALGLHILTHWAGQISLGHVAFMALGAFVTANLATRSNLPFWLAILLGALITVIGTVAIGLPALRIRGFYIAVVTLAFGLASDRWLFRQEWLTGGASGVTLPDPELFGIDVAASERFYYVVMVTTVGMVGVAYLTGRTKAGRAFRAIRADEDVAAALGINVAAYKILAFAMAGGFAAVAGGLQAFSLGIVGPQTFPVSKSIEFLAIVVMGGAGSIWGTVVAATVFGVLPTVLTGLGRYSAVAGAVGILVTIIRYPGGLNEQGRHLANIASRARKRVASARG